MVSKRDSDPAAVKRSYESAWSSVRDRLSRNVETGDHVASILARMERLNLGMHYPGYSETNRHAKKISQQVLSHYGVADPVDPQPYFCNVANGRYVVQSGVNDTRYVAGALERGRVVIELGSGWSANLFRLYVLLGERRAADVKFFAGEFTEAGRECGEMLAAHVGDDIDYTSFEFDYTKPDLDALRDLPADEPVLVFTKHSIEQVPDVNVDLLAELRDRFRSVRVVHFEPIGWQRFPDLAAARLAEDGAFFDGIARANGFESGKASVPHDGAPLSVRAQAEVAAWWSYTSGYNRNWLGVLRQDDVSVRQVVYDYDAIGNPLNPSTLVAYDLAG